MESDSGFPDRAVAGGLDRFLDTLRGNADAHPTLRALADRGLLDVGYAQLDAAGRKRWADEIARVALFGDAPPSAPLPAETGARPARASARRAAPAAAPAPGGGLIPLEAPIDRLRSVRGGNAAKLRKAGIATVRDLLYLFPNRHLDFRTQRSVARVVPGEGQTVVAVVWEANETRLGYGGKLRATQAVVGDDTGNVRVMWFGQPWVAAQLRRAGAGAQIVLSGKVSVFNGRPQFDNPEWELLGDSPDLASGVHTGRLIPVYPSPEQIPARTMRRIVHEAIELRKRGGVLQIDDPVPEAVRREAGLTTLPRAVAQAHYPDSDEAKEEARRSVAFDARAFEAHALDSLVSFRRPPAEGQAYALPREPGPATLSWAIFQTHYPASDDAKEAARRCLAFDEFLTLLLAVARKRGGAAQEPGIVLPPEPELMRSFVASLPFALTKGQQDAIAEATRDVSSGEHPMNRLLQGDVGSGKTVVALAMLLTAVAAGRQGAMMAPTEVLAEQHFLNVRRLLAGVEWTADSPDWFAARLRGRDAPVAVGLLTGSTRAKPRRELLAMIAGGELDVLVGTHALIQEGVVPPDLALAVVDEQHRFGVLQRAALRQKGAAPHLLLLSATPIPRTLALTVYGDLDVSTMPELPSGRLPVITRIVDAEHADRAEEFLVEQVRAGRQCFVVCPLIDESEAVLARAATAEYERLRATSLASVRVGLLHGRMPLAEKQAVMDAFRNGETDVLVTTPVIEVGVDVPNATVMMVQGADRFGLAQLHQLRGRVGRSEHQSYCFLLADAPSEDARERLQALAATNDGFAIAEEDLRLRGPGDYFGTRQSGLPNLRMANLADRDLLASARSAATRILAETPTLDAHPALRDAVDRYASAVAPESG